MSDDKKQDEPKTRSPLFQGAKNALDNSAIVILIIVIVLIILNHKP